MYKSPEFHDSMENQKIDIKDSKPFGTPTPKAVIVVFLVAAFVYTVWAGTVVSTAAAVHVSVLAASNFWAK